jgi:hypothetical protein
MAMAWYGLLPAPASGVASGAVGAPVVVSLTSHPARIDHVWVTIESLMRQTRKPDRLVLVVTTEEFAGAPLPPSLSGYGGKGLEIWHRRNLKPHNKYCYARKEIPGAVIVTADDDIVYPEHWLAGLLEAYARHPRCVHCYRAHPIRLGPGGALLPYNRWMKTEHVGAGPSHLLLPTGVSGVLYPPGSLPDLACDDELFMRLSPRNDDLWLHYMTILSDHPVMKLQPRNVHWLPVPDTQRAALHRNNLPQTGGVSGNDLQMAALQEHFRVDFAGFPPLGS